MARLSRVLEFFVRLRRSAIRIFARGVSGFDEGI
jgi:hypothetical protein